jgi:hypothetical protein
MLKKMLTGFVMLIALTAGSRGDDAPAKAAPTNPQFEQLKKLAGTWVEADKDGKPTDKVVSVIKVTACGSAVTETLFPGQPMEMVPSDSDCSWAMPLRGPCRSRVPSRATGFAAFHVTIAEIVARAEQVR